MLQSESARDMTGMGVTSAICNWGITFMIHGIIMIFLFEPPSISVGDLINVHPGECFYLFSTMVMPPLFYFIFYYWQTWHHYFSQITEYFCLLGTIEVDQIILHHDISKIVATSETKRRELQIWG